MNHAKKTNNALCGLILGLFFLAAGTSTTHAAFVLTLQQVGSDVVANGSGTLNTSALTIWGGSGGGVGFINPSAAILAAGDGSLNPPLWVYSGIAGPTSFGSGNNTNANSGSGDYVVLDGASGPPTLSLPRSYVSGSVIQDTATFSGSSLSSLGIAPGTYTWTWGLGAAADSLTVTAAVPEPSTWAMMATGTALLLGLTRRKAVKP
jgi:hypothetical protein